MIFKQLFDIKSSTYTYLISSGKGREALIIDPVKENVGDYIKLLKALDLKLVKVIDTHIHADHVTSASALREITNCKVAGPANDNLKCRDINFRDKDSLTLGTSLEIKAFHTPGHTDTHFSYVIEHNDRKILFSGDALLIDACGRTDFQSGSSKELFNTIKKFFYSMPDDTRVYPAHDYNNKSCSTIFHQKNDNSLIDHKINLKNFVQKMNDLKLDKPKKIDIAVPKNNKCGT